MCFLNCSYYERSFPRQKYNFPYVYRGPRPSLSFLPPWVCMPQIANHTPFNLSTHTHMIQWSGSLSLAMLSCQSKLSASCGVMHHDTQTKIQIQEGARLCWPHAPDGRGIALVFDLYDVSSKWLIMMKTNLIILIKKDGDTFWETNKKLHDQWGFLPLC